MTKKKFNIRGFSLLEIIIVISVLGLIATVGSNLFFSILRGSTKGRVLQLVKQNGNYALNVMERMIRNARSIQGVCGPDMTSLTIENADRKTTTFQFCSPEHLIASLSGTLTCAEARLTNVEVKWVETQAHEFDCTPGVSGERPAVVSINFTLEPSGAVIRPEDVASLTFQTTVSLRNY